MSNALPISRLVNVSVNLAPAGAQMQNINTLMIVGSSSIIDVVERYRTYSSVAGVATDFGTSAAEYLAAVLWFEQSPQPTTLQIGRWAQTATHAKLRCATLPAAQQAISLWDAVTTPAFMIFIDGVPTNVSPASFATAGNLNAVASLIQTALPGGSTCVWNSSYQRFEFTGADTGASATYSLLKSPTATGNIHFTVNPSPSDTITLDGTVVTFVSSLTTGNQVLIGSSLTDTLANLLAFLQASVDTNIVKMSYSVTGNYLYCVSVATGTTGDTYTLAASAASVSGADLAGGTGTDISSMLAGTSANSGSYVANGVAAESAVTAVETLDANFGQSWYAVTVLGAVDGDYEAIAAYIEASTTKHFHGVTTQESGVLVSGDTSDIAYLLKGLNYNKTCVQYSSSNPYAVVSLLARILTTDYTGNNTVITLMYKQEPGITAETLNSSQIDALEAKNCNVFVAYNDNTAIIEPGVVSSGQFIDTILGTDWLALDIQTACYNLLYTSPTKIPQTDAGNNLFVATIEAVCSQAVANGLLAPGVWDVGGFGAIKQGDFLAKGFYVYAPPIANQNTSDRAARRSVTFQVAAKLAGAIHTVSVIINVNA